jgi:predicted RNA-binding Zn ribbon-like protein
MKDVPATFLLPLDEIVEALRPSVVAALQAKEPAKASRRRDLPEALLHANKHLAAAYTRYEASINTRDEQRALKQLLAAASGARSAFKNLTNPL